MSTITVTARGVTTVREALDEVDAVVIALRERAEKVLEMLGHEIGDDDADSSGPLATTAKTAGALLATKATGKAARKGARKSAKAGRKGAKAAAKTARATAKAATKGTAKAAKGAAVELGGSVAGRAAELAGTATGTVKDKAEELVDAALAAAPDALGGRRAAKRSARWPWLLGGVGVAVVVAFAVWFKRRGRMLDAVDNTAPDAYGAVVERAELAGSLPTQQ